MDTAKLMTEHYGSNEALQVTLDVLREIHQCDLVCHLEKNMGKTTNVKMYSNNYVCNLA